MSVYSKCPICKERFVDKNSLYDHMERDHDDIIPKDIYPSQYCFNLINNVKHSKCVVCGNPTDWNTVTRKYFRFCNNPKCKQKYKKDRDERMMRVHGTTNLLDDPEQQRKMLANRSISGKYQWSDGSAVFPYTGSYENDLLKVCDIFLGFPSKDIFCPAPQTFYYEFEGEKKFYIPDMYIGSLNLLIEVKDGGDNPNTHHKIQDVDKKKEALKDAVMMKQNEFNYIKITNKNYEQFFQIIQRIRNDEDKIQRIKIIGE